MLRRSGWRGGGLVAMIVAAAVTVPVISSAPAGAASKPGAPARPAAAALDASARVTWKAPAANGSKITIYVVTPFLAGVAQPRRAFHSAALTEVVGGLTNGSAYTFKVAAHNAAGTGTASVASSSIIVGAPAAITKPELATPGNGEVRLTWRVPANNGSAITNYVVTPFLGTVAQTAQTFAAPASTEVVTGLTNGHTYTFRVAAHNALGTGVASVASAGAAPSSAAPLALAMNATIGAPILVNAQGLTLYLYGPDVMGTTSKVPAGVRPTWPPSLWSGTPTVGAGLDSAKASVGIQPGGASQVRYNGHLLYTFVTDHHPGDVTGQGADGFYVVSAAGDVIV